MDGQKTTAIPELKDVVNQEQKKDDLVSAFRHFLEHQGFEVPEEERHLLEDKEIARVLDQLILGPLFQPLEAQGSFMGAFGQFLPMISVVISIITLIVVITHK